MKTKFLILSILCLFAGSLFGEEPAPTQSGADDLRQRRTAEAQRRAAEAEEAERLRGERERAAQRTVTAERERRAEDLRLLRALEAPRLQDRPHSPPAKPWIIRASEMDAASLQNLEEDFNVMSRVLERTVLEHLQTPGRRRVPTAMGIDLQLLSGQRALPNVYVEGYGAIFFMQVDFPLLPPERVAEEEEPPDHSADSLWEQTRRELYGPAHPEPVPSPRRQRVAFARFDESTVEALKEALLQAIRHGTNMRGLAPEDWVTVTVFGMETPSFAAAQRARAPMMDPFGPDPYGMGMAPGPQPPRVRPPPPAPGTLTLRATKADVDALAEGQIEKGEFEERVSMLLY